ncbi:DUF6485 family protein [Clostridium cuniculi]|uniref:DUF6485 family protein n=1 Tax=Clostridium cuniculi TaxID=2548455 RepID=UPI001054BAA3|nr:DUF6485 family protein [Clostridium cuniculi]MDO5793415.1 DUF6485 family protein [Turicibacter sp.]
MSNLKGFCTCKNLKCPLHPTNHNKGCTPCISQNLRLKEIPNCFFNLVDGAEFRKGDSFDDFSKLILISKEEVQ